MLGTSKNEIMDYEQEYKEAIKRAKEEQEAFINLCNITGKSAIERIFPELRESEDERIRLSLMSFLNSLSEMEYPSKEEYRKWWTWLEKQGEKMPVEQDTEIHDLWVYIREWNDKFGRLPKDEDELAACIDYVMKRQKPADEIEPKFKVGDWITNGEYTWKVTAIQPLDYILQSQNGNTVDDTISHVDEYFHLWTIQDAKDGDILMANAPFIFNGNLEGGIGCPGAHCAINTLGKFQIPKYQEHWTGHHTTPATKEQCEVLFQKMIEAGYEWNADKKELKKIETLMSLDEAIEHCKEKSCGNNACALEHQQLANWLIELKELKEQKPAEWCEEDENILNDIIVFTSGYADKRVVKEWVSFLKSLTPRQRQEWSEEDEKIYQSIIDDTVQENQLDGNQITWIKFLKNRVKPQPTSEWSEYDNKMIKNIEDSLNVYSESHPCLNVVVAEELEWLKSIKDRIQSQSTSEWGEYGDKRYKKILDLLSGIGVIDDLTYEESQELQDYFKSLKPSHWKPSEEQMNALDKAKNSPANYYNIRLGLQSLYNDLLKL